MNHAIILPILIPLLTGALLLTLHRRSKLFKRTLSLLATGALLPVTLWLALLAGDDVLRVYALGDWQPPFGIMLLLDRLSAVMLLLTAVLAGLVALYACAGEDGRAPNFHALFQFQLAGINGAFLTGDLFNLFVFFEILLIASYGLLVYGNGAARARAGMHYVVLNLLGSSFFLIGVGVLYGLLGTLNMADLATRVGSADGDTAPILAAAGFLLLVVFGLKAAILPLYFWLPRTYGAANASVAALFAIMTKVGLYAILRVFTLIFGGEAGELAFFAHDWLWWLALPTLVVAAIGALGARNLQEMISYLLLLSVGTLLAVFALGSQDSIGAGLYYLLHSTLICAGLYLLADLVGRQRGALAGALQVGPGLRQPMLLGALFFIGALSVAGLPPLSGFLGKLLMLRSTGVGGAALQFWPLLLIAGLASIVTLSRAGKQLFWRNNGAMATGPLVDPLRLGVTAAFLLSSLALVVFAAPLQRYLDATAAQLLNLAPYLNIVQGAGA